MKQPLLLIGRRGATRLGVATCFAAVLLGTLMAAPAPRADDDGPVSYVKKAEREVAASPINVMDMVRRFGPVIGSPVPGRIYNPRKEAEETQPPPNPLFNPPVKGGRNPFTGPRLAATKAFDGLSDTGGTPPDGGLAVGPTHIIAAGNSAYTITNKATLAKIGPIQFTSFFSGLDSTGRLFDPRVEYDPESDRYYMLILGLDDPSRRSQVLFAVSQSNNPTGTWFRYAFDTKETSGGNDLWLDFASLGFSSQAIVFSGNMFTFPAATAGSGISCTVRILDKFRAINGQSLTPTTLTQFNSSNGGAFTVQPVLTLDPAVSTQYMVAVQNLSQLGFFQITNILSTTPSVQFSRLSVNGFTQPPGMAQLGSGVVLDGGDTRMQSAFLRSGQLWASHGVGESIGGTTRGVARVYRINPAGAGSVAQSFSLSHASLNLHYPSVDMDGFGNVLVGYTTANSGTIPSQAVSLKKSSDATFSAPTTLTVGAGAYLHAATGANRWGDYSDTQFDPSDPATVWHLGMVAETAGKWKLRVVAVRTVDEQIVVTSPNGGEGVRPGVPTSIKWNATGFSALGDVKIELSRNGGVNYSEVLADVTPNDGEFTFTPNGPSTTQARVRVSHVTKAGILDESDANFSIVDGILTVTAPVLDADLIIGRTASVSWTAEGFAQTSAANVRIEISRDAGATYSALFLSVPNDGQQDFIVAGPATDQARIRVTTISMLGTFTDESENFTIRAPSTLTVTRPNGGEQLPAGNAASIQWKSTGFKGNVSIELSRDGGLTFSQLVASTENDGAETVTLSGPDSRRGRIRVSSLNEPDVFDTSNASFSILAPSIEVTAPRGGTTLLIGRSTAVEWKSVSIDPADTVTIDLSRDGGKTFTLLVAGTPNDGSQTVSISGPTSANTVVRVTWDRNASVKGLSGAFTIANPEIRLLRPNGGEQWELGSQDVITWSSTMSGQGTVTLEISFDGGRTFRTMIAGTPNDGGQLIGVTGTLTKKALLRIRWDVDPSVRDVTDSVFQIVRRRRR